MRAIDTPDDIGAVVRIHFEIDRALTHIIETMVPNPSVLRHHYMSQRLSYLESLGLPTDRLAPARAINVLRNKFAHKEKEHIQAADIDELERAIVNLLGRPIPSNFALRHKSFRAPPREWRYDTMSPKEKFCLLGFFSLSGIATIEHDFQRLAFICKPNPNYPVPHDSG